MTYTPDGQVASVSYSGSSAPDVTYTYDAQDQVTSITDGTGTSTRTDDPFGELTSTTNGAHQTVSYSYDADGHETGVTYPLPASATWATTGTVSYTYDSAGALATVTDLKGNQMVITNDKDGQPSGVSLGVTGDTFDFAYGQDDAASSVALENSGGSALQSFAYDYAPDGEILSETDTPSTAGSPIDYAYDSRGRVTSAIPGTNGTASYMYDASGNLLTLPTQASASYGDNGELGSSTLSGTTTTYSFDADGNGLSSSQGGSTLTSGTWNGDDQLTAYTAPSASMSSATYDADGNRATASFTTTGGTSTEDNVWSGDSLLMDSDNAYIYAANQYTPVEQMNLSTGAVTYLVTDLLGSVRGAVNSSGTLAGTTSYDAWGNPQTSGGLTATTPFGYAGGYTDPDGLIYLIGRYYDPETGQFTSLDPLVDESLAPYAYTGGDPVSETDPTGDYYQPPGHSGTCASSTVPSCIFTAAADYTASKNRDAKRTTTFSDIYWDVVTVNTPITWWTGVGWFGVEVRPNGPWDLKTTIANAASAHGLCNLAPAESGEVCEIANKTNTFLAGQELPPAARSISTSGEMCYSDGSGCEKAFPHGCSKT